MFRANVPRRRTRGDSRHLSSALVLSLVSVAPFPLSTHLVSLSLLPPPFPPFPLTFFLDTFFFLLAHFTPFQAPRLAARI